MILTIVLLLFQFIAGKSYKMKKTLLLLTLCFMLCSGYKSFATHIMGGNITATQISGLTYEIKLEVYRDIAGIPITGSGVFNVMRDTGTGSLTTIASVTVPLDSAISGPFWSFSPTLGAEQYFFVDTFTFQDVGSYTITWDDCCRNGAIVNVTAPLSDAFNLNTIVLVDTLIGNSTPTFLAPPILLVPLHTAWSYNPLPFDVDGDSLYWTIDTPNTGLETRCLGYITPFSDTGGDFTLINSSGEIDWTPSTVGAYVASVLVSEFRGGVKIGEIRRDMQYWTEAVGDTIPTIDTDSLICDGSDTATVDTSGEIEYHLAANHPHTMTSYVRDPDSDSITVAAFGEVFSMADHPANFTLSSPSTHLRKAQITWTPALSDVRDNPYRNILRLGDQVFQLDKTVNIYVYREAEQSGIVKVSNVSALQLYPNPAHDQATLSLSSSKDMKMQIAVMDMQGKVVLSIVDHQANAGMNMIQLPLSGLAHGVYMVQVKSEAGVEVRKLNIQ